MKRILSMLLCVIMFISISPLQVLAESEAELAAVELPIYKDGVFYGARTGKVTEIDANYLSTGKTVTIQNSVNGHTVTAIDDYVLWGNQYSLNLVIPKTVKSIGTLGDPDDLKSITIVAEKDSVAEKYAQKNSLKTITPEENQKIIDSKNVNNKLITVYFNKSQMTDETNQYVIGQASGEDAVKVRVEDGNKTSEVSLNKTGTADIRASDAAQVTVSKKGYVTQILSFKELDKSKTESNCIYLEKDEEIIIKHIWLKKNEDGEINKYDAYHKDCIIDRTTDETTVLEADIDWKGKTYGSIQLWQSGSTFTFTKNQLSQVLKEKMDTSETIFIVVKASDGTSVKKQLKINAADFDTEGLEFNLMKSLKVTLPNSFPFVGGEAMSLDIGKFPLDICVENGKVYGVFGMTIGSYKYENKDTKTSGRPAKIKKMYLDIKNNLVGSDGKKSDAQTTIERTKRLFKGKFKDYFTRTHNENSISGNVMLTGYVEAILKPDGSLTNIDGQIVVTGSGKIEWSGQFLAPVVSIPMYWKIYFKGDSEASLSIAKIVYVITGNQETPFLPYGSFYLQLALGGGLGVGAQSLASVGGGVEGSARGDLNFKNELIHYKVSGKLSIYAEARLALLYWSKSWDVAQGTWLEGNWNYPSLQSVELMENGDMEFVCENPLEGMNDISAYRVQDQSYLDEAGLFYGSDMVSLFGTENNINVFMTNVYASPQSQLAVLENGTKIMVWLGGVPSRKSPNKTAVYYSFCKDGLWSEPAIVEDDGTADFTPLLSASEDTAWLCWQNTTRAFDEETVTAEECAGSMEINTATFNGEGFDTLPPVTNNGIYDYMPTLCATEHGAELYWLQNDNNDLLGNSSSRLLHSVNENGIWENAEIIREFSDGQIAVDVTSGEKNGQVSYAYILDTDGNPNTVTDRELFENGVVVEQNDSYDGAPSYCNGTLYWYQDGRIRTREKESVLDSETLLDTDYYEIMEGEDNRKVIVYPQSNGARSEVYAVFLDESSGVVSKPVAITDEKNHATMGSGYYNETEGLVIPIDITEVTGEIEGTEEGKEFAPLPLGQTDLYLCQYKGESKLKIDNISFDESKQVVDNNFDVTVDILNEGAYPAEAYDIVLWDTENKMPVSSGGDSNPKAADLRVTEPLGGGQTASHKLTFVLPEGFEGNYEVTVTPVTNQNNYNDASVRRDASDLQEITLFSDDLVLEASSAQDEERNYIVNGAVSNLTANTIENCLVNLYAVNAQGEETLIDSDSLDLPSFECTSVGFVLSKADADKYRLEVEPLENEINYANNSDFCTLSQTEKSEKLNVNVLVNDEVCQMSNDCSESCTVIAAVYNTSGRMLGSSSVNRHSATSEVEVSLSVSDLPEEYTVKVMCVDDHMNPLTEEMVREVK